MCDHTDLVTDEITGASTCINCSMYCEKNLQSGFVTTHNGVKTCCVTKSLILTMLEDEFDIYDDKVSTLMDSIFKVTLNNKNVKGVNKKAVVCASLYYGFWHLKKPKSFERLLMLFEITRKSGLKGLKMCQMAIQETCVSNEDIQLLKKNIHSYAPTHRENLKELILKYNIPLKYFNEIEEILIQSHLKKHKHLNDQSSSLWISCIFFWLAKVNPYIDPQEFASIDNDRCKIRHVQLKLDMLFLEKHLAV